MAEVRVRLFHDDCMTVLRELPDASVHAVITDPPYFLDQLGEDWDASKVKRTTAATQVTSLPAGMKFDPRQGLAAQRYMGEVGAECLRVLKPGGFMLAFFAPRLVHRLAVGLEDQGFHIRDLWGWIYTQNQVKAMRVSRFLAKYPDLPDDERIRLEALLEVWKTPQIKSCIEPIVCAQKPPERTFLDAFIRHGVGLVNTAARVGEDGEMFPATLMSTEPVEAAVDRAFLVPGVELDDFWPDPESVFLVPKPTKAEKGEDNVHISVKPLRLMAHLANLVTQPGAVILDPFNGSGSTGIAAAGLGRHYIGVEREAGYLELTKRRFAAALELTAWEVDGTEHRGVLDREA